MARNISAHLFDEETNYRGINCKYKKGDQISYFAAKVLIVPVATMSTAMARLNTNAPGFFILKN